MRNQPLASRGTAPLRLETLHRHREGGLNGSSRNGYGRYPDADAPAPLSQMELLERRRKQRGQS